MAIILGSTSAGTLGTVTLGELKSIIQAEGYDTDTNAVQTTMIRDVLRRLYGMRRWKFLATESSAFSATVANQGIVDFSTLGRGLQLDSVRIAYSPTDPQDLDPQDLEAVLDNRHLDPAPGAPQLWAKQGDKVVVWPIPDQSYTLKLLWYGLTTLPTADGDSILWPETHLDVIVYGVVQRLARRQRDWTGYDRAKIDFTEALMEQFRDESVDQRQVADHVKSWDGWNRFGF
jgi:hypothetical protein